MPLGFFAEARAAHKASSSSPDSSAHYPIQLPPLHPCLHPPGPLTQPAALSPTVASAASASFLPPASHHACTAAQRASRKNTPRCSGAESDWVNKRTGVAAAALERASPWLWFIFRLPLVFIVVFFALGLWDMFRARRTMLDFWFLNPAAPAYTSIDSIWNMTKCAGPLPKVWAHPNTCRTDRIMCGIERTPFYTSNVDEACFKLMEAPDVRQEPREWLRAMRPVFGDGANVVLMDSTDRLGKAYLTLIGKAAVAATYLHPSRRRAGLDLILPLPNRLMNEGVTAPRGAPGGPRKYLATFRGTVYAPFFGWDGKGSGRRHLAVLNDPARGVSVVFSGLPPSDRYVKYTNPLFLATIGACPSWAKAQLQPETDPIRGPKPVRLAAGSARGSAVAAAPAALAAPTDAYGDLMNTTYALAPGGRQPSSFRILESLAFGAVPVVLTEARLQYELPFSRTVEWGGCAVHMQYDHGRVEKTLLSPLRKLLSGAPDALARQQACDALWRRHFSSGEAVIETLYREMVATMMPGRAHEVAAALDSAAGRAA